jgi:hypothetical protein
MDIPDRGNNCGRERPQGVFEIANEHAGCIPLPSNPPAEMTKAPESIIFFILRFFIFVLVKLVQPNTEDYAPALIPTDATSCCITLLPLQLSTVFNPKPLYGFISLLSCPPIIFRPKKKSLLGQRLSTKFICLPKLLHHITRLPRQFLVSSTV